MAAVFDINEKAKVLVPRQSEQASPVFVLNSNDFVNFQKYLYTGMALPSTSSLFESLFPDHCLKADMELYHRTREVVLRISNRCNAFRVETLPTMIILGGFIANFAKDAESLTERLLTFLQALGDENVVRESDRYRSNSRLAQKVLDKLTEHGDVLDNRCRSILYPLEKFKAESMMDKRELGEVVKRLGGGIPPKEQRKGTMDQVIAEARTLLNTAKSTLDEEIVKAREDGKTKWCQYFPVTSTVLLVVDMAKSFGLFKALRLLNDRYEGEKNKGDFKEATLLALSNQVEMLANEQKDIENTISAVMLAVEKMQRAFSELKASFEDIRRNIDRVDTEMVRPEDVHQKICAIDDLADSMQTWRDVSMLATVFQRTGLVMEAREAPRDIIGDWS